MAQPSLFRQVDASLVDSRNLMKSVRHWNPGLLEYEGRLWMCYRYHRPTEDARCGTAICEIDRKTLKPKGASQHVDLEFGEEPGAHHEDARLFLFKGVPYISYTHMSNYQPGVGYSCCMRYARLLLTKAGKWKATGYWQPHYGRNSGVDREKNWMFFESQERLMCIYQDAPDRTIIELKGGEVVDEIRQPPAVWPWGEIRGGSPPIPSGPNELTAFFHSSLATEVVPHHVRYYGAAYTMEATAPFRILQISQRPLMTGSESDGHRTDPRFTAGWKPFVVFPCGAVDVGGKMLISLGVNDWCCAFARFTRDKLLLGPADGSNFKQRFFRIPNGTVGVRLSDDSGRMQLVDWSVPRGGMVGMAGEGYLRLDNPRNAEEVLQLRGINEITEQEYAQAHATRSSHYVHG